MNPYDTNIANQEQFYKALLKRFGWAEDYIYYYVYVVYAIRDSVAPILNSIEENDRLYFTQEKAYSYLRKYERSRLSLATIIPTCNRPKAIEYILNYAAVLYRRLGVDIIIFDSSDNDETKAIVEKTRANGYYNVVYERYTGLYDGFSLDHKVIEAYRLFADRYDYLWLCRDGLVPVVDEIIEKLRYYSKREVGCFIVDTKSRNDGVEIEREYCSAKDGESFLLDQASRLQTLGMLIFSGKFAKKLIAKVPLDEKTYSLWQMAAPFHLFAAEPYRVVFLTKNIFAMNPYACSTHFWSKAQKALEQWASRWSRIIEQMPDIYDKAKEKCMMVYTVDFHPFSFKSVLDMRAWGGLSLSLVQKYKEDISKTTKTPIWFFRLAACMPRFVARIICRAVVHKPTFFHKLRTLVTGDEKNS